MGVKFKNKTRSENKKKKWDPNSSGEWSTENLLKKMTQGKHHNLRNVFMKTVPG